MALSKDQILSADDMGLLEVAVPEWGGSVFVRVMTVGERDSYENEWMVNKDRGVANFRSKFLQRVLCDKKGDLLFSPAEVEKLAKKSARVITRVWEAAMKHNSLTDDDVEELDKKLNLRPSRLFLFRLAATLGMTVRQLCDTMDDDGN